MDFYAEQHGYSPKLKRASAMIDLEREQLRKTYQVCRLGFGLLAVALGLACITAILPLLARFFQGELAVLIIRIEFSSWYEWIDVPITFGSLLGTALLWGRWDHVSWQRRAGLLLAMTLVDGALGSSNTAPPWGFRIWISDINGSGSISARPWGGRSSRCWRG